jgi:ABC-type branched-subunit amino acid transport system substrate-binding protein
LFFPTSCLRLAFAAITGLGLGLGAAASPIRLGQSAPLSGRSAQLGQEYRAGALAYFSQVNQRGGINGKTIALITLDDRYEPKLTLRNTRTLLERDKVLALFGYVGTPTVQAVLPLVDAQRIPLIAPLSGAELLRTPLRPTVFNLRTSYRSELRESIKALVRAGLRRIGVIYQRDAFGLDGLRATKAALKGYNLAAVAEVSVNRNSLNNEAAAREMVAASPNGLVLVTTYGTAADLILRLRKLGNHAPVMSVSFVGTQALQNALSPHLAHGIGISQVVPFPWDGRLPVVREYQQAMRRQSQKPRYGFTSLEGFLAAKLTVEALRKAGPDPSRERLVAALDSLRSIDLGGYRVSFSPQDHEGSDFVELTYLGTQRWEP